MKKIAIIALLLISASASAQHNEWKTIKKTAVDKELPRSEFITYTKKDSALTFNFDNSSYYASLDGKWRFKMFDSREAVPSAVREKGYNFGSWATINVPGSWELQGMGEATYADGAYAFDARNGKMPADNKVGVYSTDFIVPFDWTDKDLFIRVDGCKGGCYVYINGEKAGYSEDAGSTAEFNITNYVIRGKNVVTIEEIATSTGSYLECHRGWRTTGIEGSVYVYAQPRIRIRDLLVRTTLDPTYNNGLLQASVLLKTQLLNAHSVTVHFDLYTAKGNLVGNGFKNINISSRKEDTVSFTVSIDRVKKWSAEDPYLYTMLVRIQRDGRYTEYLATKVGFRESRVAAGELLINGQPVVLRGTNYAAHNPQTGKVVSSEQTLRDLQTMKQYGINAIHTIAGPQSRHVYNIADSLGIYVIEGANLNSKGSGKDLSRGRTLANNPEWLTAHTDRVAAMYEQRKTHPSVVGWSMGYDAGNGYNMYKAYQTVKSREDTRPVMYADAERQWNTDIIFTEDASAAADHRPVILSATTADPTMWEAIISGNHTSQGGFIDTWADPSFTRSGRYTTIDDQGTAKAAANGKIASKSLVTSDGTPTERLKALGQIFGDIVIKSVDLSTGEVKLQNNMYFTNLEKYIVKFYIMSADKVVKSGEASLSVGPRQTETVTIPFSGGRGTSLRLEFYDENKLITTAEAAI